MRSWRPVDRAARRIRTGARWCARSTPILTEADVTDAIVRGATLDQLNLRAGDQIMVDEKLQRRGRTLGVLAIFGLVTSITYMLIRIF